MPMKHNQISDAPINKDEHIHLIKASGFQWFIFLLIIYWNWFLCEESWTAPDLKHLFSDLGSGWSELALNGLASHNTVKLSQEQIGTASE